MPDTTPSATLSAIRERQALASDASLGFSRMGERHDALIKSCYEDTPLLVAALEAVLEQADHFASEAERFGKLSETADEDSGAALAALAAWQAYDRCAKTFREAITTALTGAAPSSPAAAAREGETP